MLPLMMAVDFWNRKSYLLT